MAFTTDVKDELSHVRPTCSHCQRATLSALMRIDGTLYLSGSGKYRLEVVTDSVSIARLTKQLLNDIYNLHTNLTIRRSVLHQTPNYLIEAPNQPNLEFSLRDMGVLSDTGGLEMHLRPAIIEKECCSAAYLRGAFLGSGFIANPKGNYHFEISFAAEPIAEDVARIFVEKGIPARVSKRRNTYIVYLKSGDSIADFLAFTGAHTSALHFEDTRLYKSIRNDTNRATNAEIANQKKTVNAFLEFQEAVEKIRQAEAMGKLSPALREIIRLRMTHPDASLKALGEMLEPSLTKSAIAHRVQRILDFANDL